MEQYSGKATASLVLGIVFFGLYLARLFYPDWYRLCYCRINFWHPNPKSLPIRRFYTKRYS